MLALRHVKAWKCYMTIDWYYHYCADHTPKYSLFTSTAKINQCLKRDIKMQTHLIGIRSLEMKANGRCDYSAVLPWDGSHVGMPLSDSGLFPFNYNYSALLRNRCSFSKHNYPRFGISCPPCQTAYQILRDYSGYLHIEIRTKLVSLRLQVKLINVIFLINQLILSFFSFPFCFT